MAISHDKKKKMAQKMLTNEEKINKVAKFQSEAWNKRIKIRATHGKIKKKNV